MEKKKLESLLKDRKIVMLLTGFICLIFLIVYIMIRRHNKVDDTVSVDQKMNTSVPLADSDTTIKSKLELQAEKQQMSGRLQSTIPGSAQPYMYSEQDHDSKAVHATDSLYDQDRKARNYRSEQAVNQSSRYRKDNQLPRSVDSYNRNSNRNILAPEELSRNLADDDERSKSAQTQIQQSEKLLKDRERLLALLEEYKKDKEVKAKRAQDDEKVKKVNSPDEVASLAGLPASTNSFYGLYTEGLKTARDEKADRLFSSVRAVVHEQQTITSGGRVKLRLLEPMQLQGIILPIGTIIYGIGTFNTQRMSISISGIQSENKLIPCAINVYDMDGMAGIYLPNITAMQDAKQLAAQTASGTPINVPVIANNSGALMGAAAIQSVSSGLRNIANRRIQMQKATIKANYYVLLK